MALVRAPALPGQLVHSLGAPSSDRSFIEQAWACPELARAIRLTSPALAAQAERVLTGPGGDAKALAGLAESLARYLLRAALRPTPFGALSGVAVVPVGPGPAALRMTSEMNLRAVVDRGLVSRLLQRMESEPEVREALPYRGNGSVTRRGGRLVLDADLGVPSTTWPVTTRPASEIRRHLTDLAVPRSYAALLEELRRLGGENEAGRRFLDDLITQGFLLNALAPSATADPLPSLLSKLPPELPGAWRETLTSVQAQVDRFNAAPAQQQEAQYQELTRFLHARVPDLGGVQLLGTLPLEGSSSVPALWTGGLEEALEALLRLQVCRPSVPWPAYLERFEERYGLQEVPLLELLDDERGLGAPPLEPEPHDDSPGWLKPEADQWLLDQASEALRSGSLEVQISLQELRRALPMATDPYPTSVDALVRPRSPAGGTELLLAPAGFMVPSGRALGRFAVQLADLRLLLAGLARRDEDRHAAAGLAVADLQLEGRNLDLQALTAHPAVYRVSVGVPGSGDQQTHGLADVAVSVRDGAFVLRFRSTGQPFVVRTLHALVETAFPHAVRFLHRAGREHGVTAYRWHWGSAAGLTRTPRVSLGPVTLTPARWRVPEQFRRDAPLGTDFDDWCAAWGVPDWVAAGEFDQKLSVCRHLPLHRRLLARELARGASHLEELWEPPGEGLLQGPGGAHPVEVLLPMQLRLPPTPKPAPARNVPGAAPPGEARALRPGGPCLYLRVDGPRAEQDAVLTALTAPLPAGFSWFFTRYQDPGHHLRLRIFGEADVLWSVWLPALTKILDDLVHRDLAWSFRVDPYEREVERYGGWPGFLLAEQLFAEQSRAALQWRKARRTDWPLSVSLTASVDHFTRLFIPDLEGREALYHQIHAGRQLDPGITRRWSADFGTQRERLYDVFREPAVPSARAVILASALLQVNADGHLQRPLNEVLSSLLHMHCNRLGADQAQEWLTVFYLRKLLAGFRHHRPDDLEL